MVVTNPLLEGLDGVQKMSKSKGNYIGISEPPETIFSKAMSIPDGLMEKYFILATDVPDERVRLLLSPETHPREAKAELAASIVRRYYDSDEAARSWQPEDMPEVAIPRSEMSDGKVWIVKLLRLVGAASTGGEARRLVSQGGVSLGDGADSLQVVGDVDAQVAVSDATVLKVGKRRFWSLRTR